VEFIGEFAQKFAVQVQCAFLGWPTDMYEPLHLWIQKNHAAFLAEDRAAMTRDRPRVHGPRQRAAAGSARVRRTINPGIVAPFIFG
jgi:hypothetical protein